MFLITFAARQLKKLILAKGGKKPKKFLFCVSCAFSRPNNKC